MESDLPNEYIDYVIKHCQSYHREEEKRALRRYDWDQHTATEEENALITVKEEKLFGFQDHKANELFLMGKESLWEHIAKRILAEHGEEIINLCPKCGALARTPLAKQCRSCFHDWH